MDVTPYLYIPLATWVVAQGIKFTLAMVRGEVNLRYLFASGGMPSVHSAVVCSLATVALLEGGVNSPLFGITGVFAAIVMYDSFGVRRSSGEQAKTINKLIDDLSASGKVRGIENYEHLREILGHKPIEVTVGAVLGIVLAGIFLYEKISTQLSFVLSAPSLLVTKIVAIIGVVLIIGGFLVSRKIRKSTKTKARQKLATKILVVNIILGLLVFAVAFGSYQHINLLDNYLSIIIVLLAALTSNFYFWQVENRKLKQSDKVKISERRNDWISRQKKKS